MVTKDSLKPFPSSPSGWPLYIKYIRAKNKHTRHKSRSFPINIPKLDCKVNKKQINSERDLINRFS